jgi:hypothetical protein
MIGNYGVPDPSKLDKHGLPDGFESKKIHAAALVCQEYVHHPSCPQSVLDALFACVV